MFDVLSLLFSFFFFSFLLFQFIFKRLSHFIECGVGSASLLICSDKEGGR